MVCSESIGYYRFFSPAMNYRCKCFNGIQWAALLFCQAMDYSLRKSTKILKISALGLVEMTRKRVRESLAQTLCDPCLYCHGNGYIKSSTTVCYEIIRDIQRISSKNTLNRKSISVTVHPAIYDQLFEEESDFLEEMEKQSNIEISFQVDPKHHQEKFTLTIE